MHTIVPFGRTQFIACMTAPAKPAHSKTMSGGPPSAAWIAASASPGSTVGAVDSVATNSLAPISSAKRRRRSEGAATTMRIAPRRRAQ